MGKSPTHELLKHIVARVPCAVCSRHFELDDIQVLSQRGDAWLLAVHCTRCETRGLIFARMQVEERTSYEGELTAEEREWFESLPPIGVDDVLDAHRLLRDFEGDVHDLLGVRRIDHHQE